MPQSSDPTQLDLFVREAVKKDCLRIRRYPDEATARDAASILFEPPRLHAYQCSLCGYWHLAEADSASET